MSCRCNERRVALKGIARALGQADARSVRQGAQTIARTLNRDAQDLAARLTRRRP